ncbi:MAG: GNAT family N-acetyltransferase [Candidatus Krumholzibacteriota bacterium]|nr:GNAT family N-acetyltransferase [Candidatus Krumholzibacteriota bacterium]
MPEEKPGTVRPVYHCTVCGRPLPWDGGRLRLVCDSVDCHGERPRPAPIQVREGDEHDRVALLAAGRSFFGSTQLRVFGEVFPLAKSPFLVLEFSGRRAGFLSYALHFPAENDAAVVLLAVLPGYQGRGVGRALQGALEALCRPRGIQRLHIATTNDNIPGLYFYQRLGYRMATLRPGAAAAALAEHGEPGLRGFGGIPVADEIELVKELPRTMPEAPAGGPRRSP